MTSAPGESKGAAFPRTYPGLAYEVIDGDTVKLFLDLGGDIWWRPSCRLMISPKLGINAREKSEPGGPEAKAHLEVLLPRWSEIFVISLKYDKYGGRIDGVIYLPDNTNVAERMVADGYAAEWDGSGTRPVPTWPIPSPM